MAVSLKNVDSLIPNLMAGHPDALKLYETLKVEHGMTQDVGMFSITFKFPNTSEQFVCNLPQSISALMKGLVPAVTKDLCGKIVAATVTKAGEWKLGQVVGKPPATPEAKEADLVEELFGPTGLPPQSDPPKASKSVKPSPFMKPEAGKKISAELLNKPMRLQQAEHVGQKVYGTSAGSHYTTVAVGRVNVAVKLGPKSVSIRVEGRTDKELQKVHSALSTMGFEQKKAEAGQMYMSAHLQCNDLPRSRVIGAVLLSVPGKFEEMVTGQEDIE